MKKILIPLAWVLGIFLILGFIKDQIIKTAVVIAAKEVVGAEVTIDHFSLSVFKQSVRIKGFKMYNPPGFLDEVMMDIPEIAVNCDVPALVKGELHLPYLRINLKELRVIKNKEGKLNVNALKIAEKKDAARAKDEKKKEIKMRLDLVSLNIGSVVMKDYTVSGATPSVKVFNINVKDRRYKNVTDAGQLASLVMLEALKPTAIQGVGIYGAATVLGVAFLPVGVAAIVVGKDNSSFDFHQGFDETFKATVQVLKTMGRVTKEDKAKGIVMAEVQGASVTAELIRGGVTTLKVSARKFMIPRQETASGVIHEIQEKLK
ncbi:MAG: hypothetical protein HQL16_02245 [Candidatus Omnitrophica bacterium]|nr:hypothetical protein [Candidatus Omnitrophota bacterium]